MQVSDVTPEQARDLMEREGWAYLDVRTVEEFGAGHPAGAWNIPFALRDPQGRMQPNPEFLDVVQGWFGPEARLLLG